MEYAQIVAATERQFTDEERDIEGRQGELDTAQAPLDRRRRALKRKRSGFTKMVEGWRSLDVEVVSGKPSRSDVAADDEEQDEPTESTAARRLREESAGMGLLVSHVRLSSDPAEPGFTEEVGAVGD